VAYRELALPSDPFLACVWTADAPEGGDARRVLPDACVDVVWIGDRLVVAGPATGPVIARVGGPSVGVRFRIGAAGSALGLPARELLDATVPIADVWGDGGRRLEEYVAAADDRARALAEGVAARLPRGRPDPAVRAAAVALADPQARVERLDAGIGERHLRRRFAAAVGYAPKPLQRILRFQRFLRLAQPDADLAWLALDAGYADQAHLTRECGRLAGLTPTALLASGARPAGELVAPTR
jgi:Helix-turn-helix domain